MGSTLPCQKQAHYFGRPTVPKHFNVRFWYRIPIGGRFYRQQHALPPLVLPHTRDKLILQIVPNKIPTSGIVPMKSKDRQFPISFKSCVTSTFSWSFSGIFSSFFAIFCSVRSPRSKICGSATSRKDNAVRRYRLIMAPEIGCMSSVISV